MTDHSQIVGDLLNSSSFLTDSYLETAKSLFGKKRVSKELSSVHILIMYYISRKSFMMKVEEF